MTNNNTSNTRLETEGAPKDEASSPTGEVALCLSGGGYRAAGFHLGVMKTLNDLDLLDGVKFVSTASGGTITAMKFAIDRDRGISFDKFYAAMCDFLQNVNVVNDGLKKLKTTSSPHGKNDISLIRCASNIYRDHLLGKHNATKKNWTVEELVEGMKQRNTFRDLIFNSTEFRSGNNFRFRVSPERKLVYGNRNTWVKPDIGRQVDLADIIAATSCFPAVFEPMRFPEDFHFADRTKVEDPFQANSYRFRSVSLMDGGILDNQGLYGMTVSYKKTPQPFDLMIVSDTSAREDFIYEFDLDERKGGISLLSLLLVLGAVLLVLMIATIWLTYRTLVGSGSFFDAAAATFVGLFVLLLTGGILGGGIYGIIKLRSLRVMLYDFPIWQHIRNLTINDLWTIGKGRYYSLKAMVFTVFMKRIRDLQFDQTMDGIDKARCEFLFKDITVFSIIYSIIPDRHGNCAMSFRDDLKPTQKMQDIAVAANKVGTKLWLANGELESLVDCGRITICAVLLEYYWRNDRFEDLQTPDDAGSPYHNIYRKWVELREEFA